MSKKIIRIFLGLLVFIIIVINVIACNHAYNFTHFSDGNLESIKHPKDFTFGEKVNALFFGVSIPKPTSKNIPSKEFTPVRIQSEELLSAWLIRVPQHKGVVILFHGFLGTKSNLIAYSNAFNAKGYSTLMVDFMGSGGSTGHTTTIGFREKADVLASLRYIQSEFPNDKTILFGSSMGAVAIMKAIETYQIRPSKIILECPFGNMLTTVRKRFDMIDIPSFPFAELLLFYGGIQGDFSPFSHNPTEYAKHITIPTLLLYGVQDDKVSQEEINTIFYNLAVKEKKLVNLQNSGHEVYLNDDSEAWNQAVDTFLSK